jgi:hypothetical protein
VYLREDVVTPLALARAVTDSIRAFERILGTAAKGEAGFREVLPGLKDAAVLRDRNYNDAAALLYGHLIKANLFPSPSPEEDFRLTGLRAATARVLKMASRGQWAELFAAASDTSEAVREALPSVPHSVWSELKALDYFIADQGGLVFMVPIFNTDYCLSLTFQGPPEALEPRRVDLINFAGHYYARAGRRAD